MTPLLPYGSIHQRQHAKEIAIHAKEAFVHTAETVIHTTDELTHSPEKLRQTEEMIIQYLLYTFEKTGGKHAHEHWILHLSEALFSKIFFLIGA